MKDMLPSPPQLQIMEGYTLHPPRNLRHWCMDVCVCGGRGLYVLMFSWDRNSESNKFNDSDGVEDEDLLVVNSSSISLLIDLYRLSEWLNKFKEMLMLLV